MTVEVYLLSAGEPVVRYVQNFLTLRAAQADAVRWHRQEAPDQGEVAWYFFDADHHVPSSDTWYGLTATVGTSFMRQARLVTITRVWLDVPAHTADP